MNKICIVRGDTKTFRFRRVSTSEKQPILTKATKAYFTVKKDANDKQPLFQKTIENMLFDEDGYYHVTILPEDTNQLSFGRYVYDIEIIVGENNEYKRTVAMDEFEVLREVTHVYNEV